MESTATIFGAFEAHKLPSQAQTNAWIDWISRQIDEIISSLSQSGTPQLSEHGQRLATDLKQVLVAYKELGARKNGDDQLQEAIHNLSQGRVDVNADTESTKNEALSDAEKASSALQNILLIFWRHLSSLEGSAGDLASFARNILADTAELVENQAGTVKTNLRDTEAEVQEGKRDPLGQERSEGTPSDDARSRFESKMDTAKSAGSQTIGVHQSVKESAREISETASKNLENIFDSILKRAENDAAYRDSVSTIFDLASKWFNKSVDAADTLSVDHFIHDPTNRIPSALSSLNTLLERLAGGKSTRDLKESFHTAAVDVRNDPALRSYFDEVNDFVRRTIHEPTYARSVEHDERRQQLRDRWQELQEGDDRRKWHDDIDKVKFEVSSFFDRMSEDQDVRRLQEASIVFGKDLSQSMTTLNQAAAGEANWLLQDAAEVILPRTIEAFKSIPIPRTEYKDSDVEFVIEDLNLSSFRVLPGQVHIRSTTDLNIEKPSSNADASTKVKSHTHVHLKGVQFKVKDLSFWYHDESMKPISEVSGLMSVSVPQHGVDIDINLGLIPQPSKKAVDSHKHAFFTVDHVKVKLNDPTISIRKSNHSVLLTAFKPLVRSRIESSIETSLSNQITMAIQFMDELAFDVHRRAGVFHDTGMGLSSSYVSALWSEFGHLKDQPGLLSGLQTTSVGVIRDDPRTDVKFAIGAQPQIISGEKHGPEVPGSNAQSKRDQAVRLAEESKGRSEETGQRADSGVVSFMEEIKIKKEQESKSEGWKSHAFDAPT